MNKGDGLESNCYNIEDNGLAPGRMEEIVREGLVPYTFCRLSHMIS